jgi:hypothetical protein
MDGFGGFADSDLALPAMEDSAHIDGRLPL